MIDHDKALELLDLVRKDHMQLLEDARMLRDIIEHADVEGCGPWCNGVHAENGMCEGETGVWKTVSEISDRIGR